MAKRAKRTPFENWAADLPLDERLTRARESLQGVSNVASFLVRLHETNRIVLHSDTLSRQVQRSYAGNAYNNFTQALLEIELVRLCALWDKAEQDAYSIPTVIGLIDDAETIDCVAREFAKYTSDSSDWAKEYNRTTRIARNTVCLARMVANSRSLKSVQNYRNKHIAHATATTRLERKTEPLPPPKFGEMGDERRLLQVTLRMLERLERCICNVSFSWSDKEWIARDSAEALWHGVSIKVLR